LVGGSTLWFEQAGGRSSVDEELVPVGDYLLDGEGHGAEGVERLEDLPEVLSGDMAAHLEGCADVGMTQEEGDCLDVGSFLYGTRGVLVSESMRGVA